MLPRFLSPLFSTLEKYVFGFLIILYPVAVLIENNLGNIILFFVILCLSGLVNVLTPTGHVYLLDMIIVSTIYAVMFCGFKMVFDSHKYVDKPKKAWNMMGLGLMVMVLMWLCLQLLAAIQGVVI